jgi:cysteine desulfurase / selenocysteine lyase
MSIYLDNAATSHPKPEQVYRAVDHALREIGASPGRGSYRQALAASRLLFETRESLAGLFGINDSARIIFTGSTTESLNLAISGLLRPGDHAITTTMEHNSVVRPLHRAGGCGVTVTRVTGDCHGFINPRDIAAAIRPETRLIVVCHCSNVNGVIQPLEEIGRLARLANVPLLVDAAQSAGVIPIHVQHMGISLLAAPGHKGLFGPQGTGFLYIAEGIELAPLMAGGTGSHSSDLELPTTLPDRYESGTHNIPGIAGLKAGVDFIGQTGMAAIRARETDLVNQLLTGLGALPRVYLHGPPPDREQGGIVSFTVDGYDPGMLGFKLDRDYDICVRVGLHCAPDAHRTIGTYPNGTVRVSPGWFTSDEDIASFLSAMTRLLQS